MRSHTHTHTQEWQECQSWTVASTYSRRNNHGAQQGMKWVRCEPSPSNKDLRCGDVTSWQAVTLFDVVSLPVDEGARRYPTGTDVGRKRPREGRGLLMSTEAGGCCGRSQCGCLVYWTHFLLWPLQRWDVIAQQLLSWMLGQKGEKNTVRECLRRNGNSVTIKMSVRSL